MAVTRLTDIVKPEEFTGYIVENTAQASAFVESSVASRNAVIEQQLRAGSESFTIPVWLDLGDDEADIVTDVAGTTSTPEKLESAKQKVRKSFLHQSWSAMNLASELSGSDAIDRIQARAAAYWTRQLQKRLIASLSGILADNESNDGGDLIHDAGAAFSAEAVIEAAGTLGDSMRDLTAIAMHSDIYKVALKNDLIDSERESDGSFIQVFRGLRVIVDDGLPVVSGSPPEYTTVLFGPGAVGWGLTEPRIAPGTEVENAPSAGNGGGQQTLHSRVNLAVHPAGFNWVEDTVSSESPSLAELENGSNWDRVFERKNIPLAFLKTN
ncbi:MAG: hypothetical protein HND55_08815 [Pseudomonadota bacterium]|nr:MAG: hypothetical protein HND55_08815 [Pseudomonadota bacterium]